MRNLVALLRRVWALEAESSPSDRCVAFASISGEAQSFFLRESGRIEMLQPQTEDLQASSLDLQLFLDLREFVEPSGTDEDSAGCWKWMNYVAELGMLVCASTSGALVTVDVDAIDGEEVGAVDVGLRALAWSGNQEMLALVTGTGRLLVMSNDWEVLHETEIESCLPSDVMLSHSTKDDEHWRCELCWREDSQFVALNIATKAKPKGETQVGNDVAVQKVLVFTAQLEFHALGRLEDGRAITKLGSALDWSQSMSLIASCETRRSRLFVVFFERNGLRHGEFEIPSVYRPPAYRVGSLRWNVSSDILAVSLLPTSIGEENGDVRQSVVQLWTRNNYHWYLKQELRLGVENQLVDFAWDEEAAGRVSILSRSTSPQELTLYEHEFAWDVCGTEAERPQLQLQHSTQPTEGGLSTPTQCQSVAVTGVIDGSRLLLTPLHRAMVPPPFALIQVAFDATINSVVFDSRCEALLVLLASGAVVLVENYLTPTGMHDSRAGLPPPPVATRNNSSDASMSKTTVRLSPTSTTPESFALESLLWMKLNIQSRELSFAGKVGRQDQLVHFSVEYLATTAEVELIATTHHMDLYDVRRACEAVPLRDEAVGKQTALLAVQTHSGVVYMVNALSRSPSEVPVLAPLTGKLPAFSHLTVLGCGNVSEGGDLPNDAFVVVGLEASSARLFVNGELLASACSSFHYCSLPSVLLFTTQGREAQLRMAPLASLRSYSRNTAADSITCESRSIERGALLVATVGQRANVIVQMPRGNLECMSPRLLVLALVVQQIQDREYVTALDTCRRHRLDLNVLVDFDLQEFIRSFPRSFVKRFLSIRPAAVVSDRLCLFITNLHAVDVWATKYGPLLAPFSSDQLQESTFDDQEQNDPANSRGAKVNVVCRAFMDTIEELENGGDDVESALLLPFVTCAVKQFPARFDEALSKVQALLHRNEQSKDKSKLSQDRAAATRVIKHLIMLSDVDRLYSEALGLYDLELVRAVATHSQRDPKDYVPFLDRVAQLEHENWRRYTIDEHLGRHTRALTHLSALINDSDDDSEKSKLRDMALELIERGELYDQGLELFPFADAKRSTSENDRAFRRQILLLKGDFLEAAKKYEAAAYLYLSASDQEKARRAFLAANKWQMALALSARNRQDADNLRNEAYSIAQELLNKQHQQQDGSIQDILAVARIYVEYCNDIDEAVALLVTHQQWTEALRLAYLHKRDDLVESDVETGVLQCCDDVLDELERKEKSYVKHWTRLSTIREQKRLFKLHGIDGSRWDYGNGDTDATSIRSGASSAADSALSNVSMSSVGSHNSAASIGNFSMQSLSAATASHFYATQALGDANKKSKSKVKHGGMPSRRERRKRMKEGSAEEEAYVEQQLTELRPNAALAREVGALLEMLIFFGHVQQAQKLQTQLAGFEQCVADKPTPAPTLALEDGISSTGTKQDSAEYPQWRVEALQG